jgi:hypothetical protein
MEIITRKQAQQQGLTRYFTGKPCKNGHIAERQTSKGVCVDCHKVCRDERQASGKTRAYYAEKMATDPAFRQRKRDDANKHYHNVMKHDGERMRRHYEKCAEYRQTEAGKVASQEARRRFVESGAKAESDRRYRSTDKGQSVVNASRKKYMAKVAEEVGMPYGTYRLQTNIQQRFHSRLNTRITMAIKREGGEKSVNTAELVGCSILSLRAWLAESFTPGMNWDNYGEWHLEHTRPCASFDLTDPDQQRVCMNWRNLQPMWGRDNIIKGDKWTPKMEAEWAANMRAMGFEGDLFLAFEQAVAA